MKNHFLDSAGRSVQSLDSLTVTCAGQLKLANYPVVTILQRAGWDTGPC